MSAPLNTRDMLRARLQLAIQTLIRRSPGKRFSVVAVCSEARVSRSALYASHPELLREIAEQLALGSRPAPRGELTTLRRRNAELSAVNRSLAAECVELRLALKSALDKLDSQSRDQSLRRQREQAPKRRQ